MQTMDATAARTAPAAPRPAHLPALAWLLGLAGLLPFLGAGLLALGNDPVAAGRGLGALVAYGAVILAFLGGVHWGTALAEPVGYPAPQTAGIQRARLGLGVVPSLVGWVALLLPQALPEPSGAWAALALLIAGFAGTTTVESRAARRGLLPRRYMLLRWLLSAIVVIILVSVLILRLLGAHLNW
jgi:hypothetical protein